MILKGAPTHVLDVFDDPRDVKRYTVFYTKYPYPVHPMQVIPYRNMSEHLSTWGEISEPQAKAYRRRNKRFQVLWSSLPKTVQAQTIKDCESLSPQPETVLKTVYVLHEGHPWRVYSDHL